MLNRGPRLLQPIIYTSARDTKNRSVVDRHARVGSGGVGILISDSILSDFHVSEIVDTFEGSLAVLLKHKYREKSIVVICSYLPPEHTKYGVEPDIFFEALTQLIYIYIHKC